MGRKFYICPNSTSNCEDCGHINPHSFRNDCEMSCASGTGKCILVESDKMYICSNRDCDKTLECKHLGEHKYRKDCNIKCSQGYRCMQTQITDKSTRVLTAKATSKATRQYMRNNSE